MRRKAEGNIKDKKYVIITKAKGRGKYQRLQIIRNNSEAAGQGQKEIFAEIVHIEIQRPWAEGKIRD